MNLPVNVTLGLDKLVETVANATGLTALGTIMNAYGEAKAQTYLAKQKAQTEAEIEILKMQGQEKVAQYILARNNQKVENVSEIVSKAQQQFEIGEKVSSEPVDNDWMTRFLGIAEDVSDNEMQELWARVLAGEVKHPHSYSLRTLEVLRNISKEEAGLIAKVSAFVFEMNYLCNEDFALNLQDKITLDDIGMVCGEDLIHSKTVTVEKLSFVLNHCQIMNIYAPVGTKFEIRCVRLTKAGSEIVRLVQGIDYQKYLQSISAKIKQQGASKVTINQIFKWEGIQYHYLLQEIEV